MLIGFNSTLLGQELLFLSFLVVLIKASSFLVLIKVMRACDNLHSLWNSINVMTEEYIYSWKLLYNMVMQWCRGGNERGCGCAAGVQAVQVVMEA